MHDEYPRDRDQGFLLGAAAAVGNRAVGGAPASKHMDGTAFDIAMANHDPVAFEATAREMGFQGFGFYPRSGFMHIDLGSERHWGERFPIRATAFAEETPPARESLADSRTMKGGGARGAGGQPLVRKAATAIGITVTSKASSIGTIMKRRRHSEGAARSRCADMAAD